MGQTSDVSEAESWWSWLCDEPVDRARGVSSSNRLATTTRLTVIRFRP